MAFPTDGPFDPVANPAWINVLNASVPGFPGQDFNNILDTQKVDQSVPIPPSSIHTNIGRVWGDTVDTFMRVTWPAAVSVLTGGISGGDVTGPGSSVDNEVVRFDGTTGKIIQSGSLVNIDDSGNVRAASAGTVNIGTTAGDTVPAVTIATDGANGAAPSIFSGTRDPEGNVSGNPGDFYYRVAGASSLMYQHRGASPGTTGWTTDVSSGTVEAQMVFYLGGNQTVGLDRGPHLRPFTSGTLTEVFIDLNFADSGTAEFDVRKNGTTIFTGGNPQIVGPATTVTKALSPTVSYVKDDAFLIDVVSGTDWSGAAIHLRGTVNLV